MVTTDELVDRLDRLISLFTIAFADQIGAAKAVVRSDPVSRSILEACDSAWTPAQSLHDAAAEAGASPRTATRRISELVTMGALVRQGATHTSSYRLTGVL